MRYPIWCMILVLVGVAAPAMVPAAPEVFVSAMPGTDGRPIVMAVAPVLPLAEMMDAQVAVTARAVTVTYAGHTLTLTLGETTMVRDGMAVTLPTPPVSVSGVIYAPLRAVIEALGGSVHHEARAQRMVLTVPTRSRPLILRGVPRTGAVTTLRNTTAELYVMNLDGSGLRRLTYSLGEERDPVCSPDGRTLAYVRDGSLYLRAVDDPQERVLLAGSPADLCYETPQFSPDGSQIVFAVKNSDGIVSVGLVRTDGTARRLLAMGDTPQFSPDGRHIAFVRHGDVFVDASLYLMANDGSHLRRIGARLDAPRFSPDGVQLVCTEYWDAQRLEPAVVVTVDIDKSTVGKPMRPAGDPHNANDHTGCFTPDGRQLVIGKKSGIWISQPDRTHEQQLLNDVVYAPTVTPDGRTVVYQQLQSSGGRLALCRIPLSGGTAITLTSPRALPYLGAFAITPDSQYIVFTAAQEMIY